MITGEVGENGSSKGDALDAALNTRMRAHLHEGIFTTRLDHLVQQPVKGQMVRGRLFGLHCLFVNDIPDSGHQSGLVAQELCHLIEQRGRRCLAVGTCYSYQAQ